MPHAARHVVAEADRPALRRDRQAGQVHDHRIPPAGDPHRPARVGDHREPRQPRLAVGRRRRRRRPPRSGSRPARSARFSSVGLASSDRHRDSSASGLHALRLRLRRSGSSLAVSAGCGLRHRQPQFLHQRHFLGPLPEFALPVAALAGVLVGQRGRVVLQAAWPGRWLPWPDRRAPGRPRTTGARDRGRRPSASSSGKKFADQDRLVEPGPQHAVEHDQPKLVLVDADRLVVGLMIEPAGGVVVARASCRRRR